MLHAFGPQKFGLQTMPCWNRPSNVLDRQEIAVVGLWQDDYQNNIYQMCICVTCGYYYKSVIRVYSKLINVWEQGIIVLGI